MPKAPDTITARGLHEILIRNLHALDEGLVPPARAHAIARLGGTIFQGVNLRLKVVAMSADCRVPDDIEAFAK